MIAREFVFSYTEISKVVLKEGMIIPKPRVEKVNISTTTPTLQGFYLLLFMLIHILFFPSGKH